jgi:tRNA U34 5-methylaminomethyl-2-thiouridine-forming methyltransferase MnmC
MQEFNTQTHTMTPSADGSFTAYSTEYQEHYHSTKDGAWQESLQKHILPALQHTQALEEVHILDICYGLGFNTLATILHYKTFAPHKKLFIYSPELDKKLVASLIHFQYPKEFLQLREIIVALSTQGYYTQGGITIELFLGDAREYIKKFDSHFDVVYQDPFSPSVNPVLWTREYFADIKKGMKQSGILTTYSTALKTRLALYENGFYIYLNKGEGFRNATLASLKPLSGYEEVNMAHKIACNKGVSPLSDALL